MKIGASQPLQMCPKCSQNNNLTARNCIYCGSPLPSTPLLAKGTLLNNRYSVLSVLGFGGFSAVYLAFDRRMNNRLVAIKELLQTDPDIVKQFETEARILATLSHPSLPQAFDWFKQFGTDRYYLVMEFIDGVSVWEAVSRRGFLDARKALNIIEPVMKAVSYLHHRNPPIIHRDIKPQNIIVTKDRRVYLVDFGIAKIGGAGQKTATGARGVTPGFSPLEQYSGVGETDYRSDIYSLGATLYFMLTSKVPPEAVERLQKEMAGQPSLEPIRSINPSVSPQMELAIYTAMALRKEQRFNSVDEFLASLKGETLQLPAQLPQLPVPSTSPSPQTPSSPQPPAPQQPNPPQPIPAQILQPPIAFGARDWCPSCKQQFFIADPRQEWVNCPYCGQLIHRPQPLSQRTDGSGFAIASLVLGIVSLVSVFIWFLALPCAILAVVFSAVSMRRSEPARGMATAGLVLGLVTLGILAIFFIAVLIGVSLPSLHNK